MQRNTLFILILSLLYCTNSMAADPALEVKLLWEGPYTIAVKKNNDTLRIPVTINTSSVQANDLLVLIRPDDPLAGKLNGYFETDSSKSSLLVLTLSKIEDVRPDTYTSFVLLKKKQSELQQLLKLTIVVKPAIITVSSPVTLTYTRTMFGPDELEGTPLVLSEISGETRLGNFQILAAQQSPSGAPANMLHFEATVNGIAPFTTDTIHSKLTSIPDPGTSSGKFQIIATRLATPLSFQVDLTTKRSGAYLLLYLLIGLACGLFFRVWLTQDIELSKARLAATETMGRILNEIKNRNDPAFVESVYLIYQALEKARLGTTTAEITTATSTAESALTAAINDYNTRSAAVKTKLTGLENELWGNRKLPEAFFRIIEDGQVRFNEAKATYESGNMVSASNAATSLERFLADRLFDTAFNYRLQINASLASIENARLKIPDLPSALTVIKTDIASIPPAQTGATISDLLTKLQQAHTDLPDLLNLLQQKICKAVNDVLQTFEDADIALPDPAAIKSLREEAAKIIGNWSKLTSYEQQLNAIANSLDSLYKLVLTAVVNQIKEIKGADQDKENAIETARRQIRSKIDSGDTLNASMDSILLLKNNNAQPRQDQKQEFQLIKYSKGPGDVFSKLADPIGLKNKTVEAIEKQVQDTNHLMKKLILAQLAQTIFAGIGIVLVGYIIFKDGFIGSLPNFVSVFLWAFGMDISLASLVTNASKIAKP